MTKTARAILDNPAMCILDDGRREYTISAEAAGFTVFSPERQATIRAIAEEKANRPGATHDERVYARMDLEKIKAEEYAHAIRSLPEAVGRPGAVARIIAAHNETSMQAARAAVFLAGLPEERPEAEAKPAGDPLAHRVVLAFEAATVRGDTVRADKLKAAVAMHRDHGESLARALEIFRFDPRTI